MDELSYIEMDFTERALDTFYNTVDDPYFLEKDASLIFSTLQSKIKPVPFGEYLKRYLYKKAQISVPFEEVGLKDYQQIIKFAFDENGVPPSFTPTTAKLSALSKNWLTQSSVKRNVVFLLGFGLRMSREDVNDFLKKALKEQAANPKDPFELICDYCFGNQYSFDTFRDLWEKYRKACTDIKSQSALLLDRTVNVRSIASEISSHDEIIRLALSLTSAKAEPIFSITKKEHFLALFGEARRLTADALGKAPEDISVYDMEQIISSAVPRDNNGNLISAKSSVLSEQISGKRFSRHHIDSVLSGKADADRFDLITLNFYNYSCSLDRFENNLARYSAFIESTNKILEDCSLNPLYAANSYECFILMCILSEYPLGTYSDVIELSYPNEQ